MFGEVPEIWIWVGGAVIAGAAIYLAQKEGAATRTVKQKKTPTA